MHILYPVCVATYPSAAFGNGRGVCVCVESWTGGSRSNAEDRQGRDKKRAGALHVDRSGRARQNGGARSSGVIATERENFRSRHSRSSDGIIYQWGSDPPVMLASTKIRETGCERRCLHVAVIHACCTCASRASRHCCPGFSRRVERRVSRSMRGMAGPARTSWLPLS